MLVFTYIVKHVGGVLISGAFTISHHTQIICYRSAILFDLFSFTFFDLYEYFEFGCLGKPASHLSTCPIYRHIFHLCIHIT